MIKYRSDQPYNDLPPLPEQPEWWDNELEQHLVKASRSLAELKGLCSSLPDPEILVQALVLQESRDSSAIENIVTTQDELYRTLADDYPETGAAKEVLHYREALYAGLESMRNRYNLLTTTTLETIVGIIRQNNEGIRKVPGTLLKNTAGQIIYTPPCCEEVLREKLAQLEHYLHNNSCDPLLKLALIHYQFEAIHPFSDGNGRTGRILNSLFLVQSGLLESPVLYLSAYINEYKGEYYRRLRAVTEQEAWKPWCMFMLTAVYETAELTRLRIRNILSLMREEQRIIQQTLGASYDHRLFQLLFTLPYLKTEILVRHELGHRETVSRYLHRLEAAGILQKVKKGRTNYFIHTRLLRILSGG